MAIKFSINRKSGQHLHNPYQTTGLCYFNIVHALCEQLSLFTRALIDILHPIAEVHLFPRTHHLSTYNLNNLSHPIRNIKQSNTHSLTSKIDFNHNDSKPSKHKNKKIKKCPTQFLSQDPQLTIWKQKNKTTGHLRGRLLAGGEDKILRWLSGL